MMSLPNPQQTISNQEGGRGLQTRRLFFIVLLYWFALYVHMPYQTIYLTLLGTSTSLIGAAAGAYGYAQIALRIPLSIMADGRGRQKPFMLIGTLVPVLAAITRVLWPSAPGYLLGNLVSGIGAAMWVCFIVDYTNRQSAGKGGSGSALINTANQMGVFLGFLFSMFAYRDGHMEILMYASMFCGALASLLMLGLHEYSPASSSAASPSPTSSSASQSRKDSPSISLKAVLMNKNLQKFAVFGFLQTGVLLASVQSFSTQIVKDLGGNNIQVGLMNVIFMFVSVLVAMLMSRPAINRFGSRSWLFVAYLLMALYHFLVPQVKQIPVLLLLQSIGGINAGIVAGFAIGGALETVPAARRNTAMGIYQTSVALGITLIPTISGLVVKNFSLSRAYYALGCICLLAAFYALTFKRKA